MHPVQSLDAIIHSLLGARNHIQLYLLARAKVLQNTKLVGHWMTGLAYQTLETCVSLSFHRAGLPLSPPVLSYM